MWGLEFNKNNFPEEYPEVIPYDIEFICLTSLELDKIPENLKYATNLKKLVISLNKITILENLPPNLEILYCNFNKITEIRTLPSTLKELRINYNKLTELKDLPPNLEILDCADNNIEHIYNLPKNLKVLDCSVNKLKRLPLLPTILKELYCNYNRIRTLPLLPETVIHLYCDSLECINNLPSNCKVKNESIEEFRLHTLQMVRTNARIELFKEELMMNRWHPDRVEKMIEMYGIDFDDFV